MAKQPLNKPLNKQNLLEESSNQNTTNENSDKQNSQNKIDNQAIPKKENIFVRILLFPFRWVLKKIVTFIVFILILAAGIFLIWDKIPNILMAILSDFRPSKQQGSNETDIIKPTPQQIIYMQFYGKTMELDGNECRGTGELLPIINQLRQKYKDKKIIVIYKKSKDDAYILADEYVKTLQGHNISVTEELKNE